MSKTCYYEVLGLEKNASADDIKKAYRKKLKENHPDRNQDDPNAEAKFKAVNEAKDVLQDQQKKAAYDRGGFAALEELENGGGQRENSAPTFRSRFDDVFGKAGSDKDAGGADDTDQLFQRSRARRGNGSQPGQRRNTRPRI
jgi:molecular chaperone DnaJ